ncbi:hypothetical protein N7492_009873 [Penicillium capsulatum]|uniref:Mediator of RNA polymerase II transcription subunit 17 n=1 Tax=Penicillium capsulatum TaxID=69766 RepID=A0A9W9HKH0_9EURO|nr:hypothetical protein N7492_009873 [Penicillium capsulatum]KAJ6112384.1 hypothetical protein N7512_007708 [Penicillium capsulatum]
MSDSFTLPLRPVQEKQDHPDSLPVEIAQINNEWGSFRDVNEEVLRARIAEEERDGTSKTENDAEEVDSTERLEQLYKRRADILQFAMQSHMETMFALDFVSLLLSKHTPRQAETSMSPFLKQAAPLGSLHAEVVTPPPKPESAAQDTSTVSRGWRIQNFTSASNKLLKAATRLEEEVGSEARYWKEVLEVKDKGWKICRLPRERQALGVQYGFMEATPVFRDRGLASLRRGEDGRLVLDKGLVPAGVRFVRVRVKQGSEISSSTMPRDLASINAESVEQRILQARDSVFEEELFQELNREARAMASCGVTTRQNLIQVPVSDDVHILVDLVDDVDDVDQDSPGPNNALADGLAHSFRLLLAFAHRQNLHRRIQIPAPLTTKRRPTPEYHLIRPALAYLQHLSHVRWLEAFLDDIQEVLRASCLDIPEYTTNTFSGQKPTSAPTLESLVGQFLTPIESVFQGGLRSARGSFRVAVRTNLSAPPFGTQFDVSFSYSPISDLKSPGQMGLPFEVESAIAHFLLLDVVCSVSSKDLPNGDKESTRNWKPIYPHLGELLLPSDNPEKHKKLKISLSRHGLSASAYVVRGIGGIRRGLDEVRSRHPAQTWDSTSETPIMDFVVAAAE